MYVMYTVSFHYGLNLLHVYVPTMILNTASMYIQWTCTLWLSLSEARVLRSLALHIETFPNAISLVMPPLF